MGRIEERKANIERKSEDSAVIAKHYIEVYARYSGIAIQMLVLIGLGTWLGFYLDEKYDTKPIWIVLCSLCGVLFSILILFRSFLYVRKKDNK